MENRLLVKIRVPVAVLILAYSLPLQCGVTATTYCFPLRFLRSGFRELPNGTFFDGVAMEIDHDSSKLCKPFGLGGGEIRSLPKILFDIVKLEGNQFELLIFGMSGALRPCVFARASSSECAMST